MTLLLASYLTITWTNQSLGADETIIAEKNNNAQLSNITLTPTEKAWLEKNEVSRLKVKAIIPVHLFGQVAEIMDRIVGEAVADREQADRLVRRIGTKR